MTTQLRNSNNKPGAPAQQKKRHPKHADKHNARALKKEHTKAQPEREGKGAPSNLPLTESRAGNGTAFSFDW